MELSITNNRICASMPRHQLCLDYQLPAIQKIFTKLLEKHPLIPDCKNCHFSKISKNLSTIFCSFEQDINDSYHVKAHETKIPGYLPSLTISLSKDGMDKFEELECQKNGCRASIYSGPNISFRYYFQHFSGTICSEYGTLSNTHYGNDVPCDETGPLFEKYLKHATVTLALPQPLPPPNPPPPPQGQNPQTGGAPSGNSTSQNTSYFQTGLGAAGTIYFSYKAYQEMEKMDEEGRRSEATPRQNGQAANPDKKSSSHRALGYVAAAIAAGAFTIYSLKV